MKTNQIKRRLKKRTQKKVVATMTQGIKKHKLLRARDFAENNLSLKKFKSHGK